VRSIRRRSSGSSWRRTRSEDKNRHLVAIRFRRALTDDSPLQTQAESEILAFLPPLPRSAKRMLNHLRILLTIAVAKEIFGGSPALEAKHLGKWVVLSERWPELARALSQHPEDMAALEACHDEAQLQAALTAIAPDLESSSDLYQFMADETKLGPVIARLVHVDPTARARTQAAGDPLRASPPAH
jgi:hypothetical protein